MGKRLSSREKFNSNSISQQQQIKYLSKIIEGKLWTWAKNK